MSSVIGGSGSEAPPSIGGLIGFADPPDGHWEGLQWFAQSLETLLATTLRFPFLLHPYGDDFRKAWPHAQAAFDDLKSALRAGDAATEDALRRHGLTDEQLALKIRVYHDAFMETMHAFERLRARPEVTFGVGVIDPAHDVTYGDIATGKTKKLRKAIAKAFPVGDKLLQSAGAAIGVAHPVAGAASSGLDEFKSFAGSAVKWGKGKFKEVKAKRAEAKRAKEAAEPEPQAASR